MLICSEKIFTTTMKKLLLTFVFIVFAQNFSEAQVVVQKENDRFTKNNVIQVNAMTGKRWRTADDIAKGIYSVTYLSLKSENNTRVLQLNIGVFSNTCLVEDGKLILLFSDNSTIELINKGRTDCVSKHQSLLGKYLITDEQIAELSEKELTEFRVYFSEGYRNYEVREKAVPVIQGTAKLLLEELQTFE